MTINNDQDYIKSMPLYDKAIENDPLNATAWFWRGLKYVSLGYLEKAKSDIKQCIELDPSYTNCLRHLGRVYMSQGDAEKALEYYLASQERGLMGVDFWAVYPLMASGNRIATVLVLRVQSQDDPDYPIWEFLAALDHPDGNQGRPGTP